MDTVLFWLMATVAVVASVLVVGQRHPMYSVLLLILSFAALAGLYVMLDAPFVAVTQIIVYAGAIMVLFLFVVMLLNVSHEEVDRDAERGEGASAARWFGALLAVAMACELAWAVNRARALAAAPGGAERETAWSVAEIGNILFTNYAFAFEA